MKKIYASQMFRQLSLMVLLFLITSLLHAQVMSVQLKGYPACGGEILVPSVAFSANITPVTIYYEK